MSIGMFVSTRRQNHACNCNNRRHPIFSINIQFTQEVQGQNKANIRLIWFCLRLHLVLFTARFWRVSSAAMRIFSFTLASLISTVHCNFVAAASIDIPAYERDRAAVPNLDIGATQRIGASRANADVDGDGRVDVLYFGTQFDFVAQTNPPLPIFVYHNLGAGNFSLGDANQLIGGNIPDIALARRILSAELNGDSRLDVIVSNHGVDFEPYPGEENLLFLSSGSGALASTTMNFPQFSDFSHDVSTGDIDGDSDADIFFANICCGIVGPYFLINDSAGGFTFDQTRIPTFFLEINGGRPGQFGDVKNAILSAEIVDVDGDGHVDLALGLSAQSPVPGMLLLNNNSGDYSSAALMGFPTGLFGAGSTMTPDLLALDVNGDGLSDLLASQANQDHTGAKVQVLISNGDGTFRDESYRFPTNFPFNPNPNQFWIERLEIIDFNNDGYKDVLVQFADSGQTKTKIFVNNGAGFFQQIPDGIIPNTHTAGREYVGVLSDSLALFPVIDESANLLFLGPEFNCVEGSAELGCTKRILETSVYRPNLAMIVTMEIESDSDNDGMIDEIDTDDDGDGLPDSYESAHDLDPLNPNDALIDIDSDGKTNLEEFQAGTDPRINEPAVTAIINAILGE